MRIFIYEFITGGGLWHWADEPVPSGLLREGRAMIRAAISDFGRLANVQVVTTRDVRWPLLFDDLEAIPIAGGKEELDGIAGLCAEADWSLLIAPETGGALLDRCRVIERCGGRLLSPSPAVVEIAANKQATAELLSRAGVAVPCGLVCAPGDPPPAALAFPIVAKPIDGCGSLGVRLVSSIAEFDALDRAEALRCEPLVPGLPASVGVLCGPAGNRALPACQQRLSADGRFTYLGGRVPLAANLDERARQLALAAVSALPSPVGFVGVDLVLGDAADGSGDYVIEINPRLTTSYVGLRAACRSNLAAVMLAVATGQAPDLCFRPEPIEFTADGTIVE